MIKTLADNEVYRSFLDDRTGDVIFQVHDIDFYGNEVYYEAIVRADGRVDSRKGHDRNRQEAVKMLIETDDISLEDADDYLHRLAKRDKENA